VFHTGLIALSVQYDWIPVDAASVANKVGSDDWHAARNGARWKGTHFVVSREN